jgi:hypothetical protein
MRCSHTKINYINLDFFRTIDNEEKAYWLGFIYADGNVSKNRNMFQINLQIKDYSHLMKLTNIFNGKTKIYNIKCDKIEWGFKKKLIQQCRLTICNQELKNDLISKGVVPMKSYIDSIDIFNYIPDNLLNHFVRGYFDGDGWISKIKSEKWGESYKIGFVGQFKFIEKIKNILIRQVNMKDKKINQSNGCVTMEIRGRKQIKSVVTWLYKNSSIYLERKFLIAQSFLPI